MTLEQKGHCKHGEFALLAGCSQCLAERFHLAEKKNLIKVRYYSDTPEGLSGREYTYYTAEPLKVGDTVMVPVRDTIGKAQVSAIDVPESEVAAFREKVKTIPAGSVIQSTIPEAKPLITSDDLFTLSEAVKVAADREDVTVLNDGTVITSNGTVALRVYPEQDPAVSNLLTEITSARAAADRFVVTSLEDVKMATNDLTLISKLKKALTEKRREYVDPLNAWVKGINEAFKKLSDPLDEADKIVRGKVETFNNEQRRKQLQAEETNRMAAEVARRQAEESGTGEFKVDLTPVVVPVVTKTARTELGNSTMVDNWTYEVTDMELLPRAYMMPDDAILKAIAKKYHDTHPVAGVKFENHPTLRVSSR